MANEMKCDECGTRMDQSASVRRDGKNLCAPCAARHQEQKPDRAGKPHIE
jgi:formylmethanofuran dehydrogenase subunit E